MMDVKEKLVELQSIVICPNAICNFCEHFKNKNACEKHKKEVIANNMIANGVTVQEWIPVKDRLPEKDGDYLIYATVPFNGRTFMVVTHYEKGAYLPIWSDASHWMPLPQPPSGG